MADESQAGRFIADPETGATRPATKEENAVPHGKVVAVTKAPAKKEK